MTNNDVNNQIKINGLFGLCRYIAVVFGVILLSTWTVKSASLENLSQYKFQQDAFKEITGVVKTQEGDPIPGVVVKLAGTNVETVTDAEGRYKFDANEGDKISFYIEGFEITTVTVGKSNILNVTMIEDGIDLSNVKNNVASKIKSSGFPHQRSQEIIQILSGHFPLNVTTEPKAKTVTTTPKIGCGYSRRHSLTELLQGQLISIDFSKRYNPSERHPEVILKDVENLTRNGNYTYIVDGVRVSEETFRSLNQNDVESVDIYKHTDVYNARFGNKENQSRITLEAR